MDSRGGERLELLVGTRGTGREAASEGAVTGEDGRDQMATERIAPPLTGGERETLRAFLDFHRATLAMKCDGLSDEQLRLQSSPPSTLSLLGLVRHMAEVERTWFRRVIDKEDIGLVWSPEGDFQAAYDAVDADRAEAFAVWQAEVDHARRIEREAESLDVTGYMPRWRRTSRCGWSCCT